MVETVRSTCPHDCPSVCGLLVERLPDGTVGKVKGDPDHDYTRGVICAKVSRYRERNHHPDRLVRPLLRTGAKGIGREAFVEIEWDDALDRVVNGMQQAVERHGSEAVWPYQYAGTMGLVQRQAINKLRHAARYSGQKETICTALAVPGVVAGLGSRRGVDPREMLDAELIVIWGCNAVHTQVNVMHFVAEARRNGAKLVVIDPYRNATAEKADQHLMLRPGTDAALACAVMHVLIEEGLADQAFLDSQTDADDAFYAHLRARDPAWAAAITGLSAEEIVAFARLYGATRRSFLRLGFGHTRSRNGAMSMHAAQCLPAVTGAWQVRGGGALQATGVYHMNQALVTGADHAEPAIRTLDQSRIGPILDGSGAEMQGTPPVAALLIQNTNPVTVAPESVRVRNGFLRDDLFICVHEQFMTDTAAMADVVLPATTFLEHDDLYLAGGHTYMGLGLKVVEPPGEAWSNTAVIRALAQRLGVEHPHFGLSDIEQIDALLAASGHPPHTTFEDGVRLDCALPEHTAHFRDGFDHPDGRFHFSADWRALGDTAGRLPALPDYVELIEQPTDALPFRLVTAPARWFLNTSFTEGEVNRRREGQPLLLIHPDDIVALGLQNGDWAEIGNERACLSLPVSAFEGVQCGVVIVHSIWPHSAYRDGLGVNALVGADSPPPNGGAAFHDTAVFVRRAAS
ncbi:MAG: molybdopterin-dependent oxidoreductase [Pseudomonadota bacterium]